MKEKTCIKRKHIFLGSILAYPIGYTLYSWYYWITHLHLVEHYRNDLANRYGYTETSAWDYISYPFYETVCNYEPIFFVTIIFTICYLSSAGLLHIYQSKFMNKCIVKRK